MSFSVAPPLLALEFSRCNIEIDRSIKINVHGDLHGYSLAGVVYFKSGESHFVSNIIMEDNQVWYYDGLINGGQMVNLRQLDANSPMLSTCRGRSAVMAFKLYVKDLGPQIWGLVHATQRDGPHEQVTDGNMGITLAGKLCWYACPARNR
jgi:hypothetical protein